MGTLEKTADGRHVFKGGFSTKNKEDMQQLTDTILKPIENNKGDLKEIAEPEEPTDTAEPASEEPPKQGE